MCPGLKMFNDLSSSRNNPFSTGILAHLVLYFPTVHHVLKIPYKYISFLIGFFKFLTQNWGLSSSSKHDKAVTSKLLCIIFCELFVGFSGTANYSIFGGGGGGCLERGPYHTACEILLVVPQPDLNLYLLHWKGRVLTTELPEKSPYLIDFGKLCFHCHLSWGIF